MATDLTKIGTSLTTASPTQIAQSTPTVATSATPKAITQQPVQPITATPNYVNPNANYFSSTAPILPITGQATAPTATPATTPNTPVSTDPNAVLTAKYQGGLQTAQTSGVTAPTTQGQGSAMVNGITGGPTPQPTVNPVDSLLSQDKGYQDLLKTYNDYKSAESQKESLTNEYTRLTKEAGVEGINTELLHDKNIIDGTEQDIRNEVQAVGGFATESQVQGLAAARNKTLIQNYNNLLQTRDNAVNNINTMIGLSQQDRQYAQTQLTNQLNFQNQINDYTQKFTQNAQEGLKYMQQSEGWDGIYKAALATGDPTAVARINAMMGNGFDLASMAKADEATRIATNAKSSLDIQKEQADIANTKANTAKTNQELNDASGQPNPAKANQPGYSTTGVKYTSASASTEIEQDIKNSGLTGTRHLLAPSDYNTYKAWWVTNGLSATDFDNIFGGYKDTSSKVKPLYN